MECHSPNRQHVDVAHIQPTGRPRHRISRPKIQSPIRDCSDEAQFGLDIARFSECLEQVSAVSALNRDDCYVQKWLGKTKNITGQDHDAGGRVQPIRQHENGIPNTPNNIQPLHQTASAPVANAKFLVRKRSHTTPSDSSILGDAARKPSSILERPLEVNIVPVPRGRTRPQNQGHRVETLRSGSGNTSSSHSTPSQKDFQKRKRHKTRENRYEPKQKSRRAIKTESHKPQKPRERKRGLKNFRKAGEDLMHDFSSQHISQKRLTVRPLHGPGVFNNGRASSAPKARGIPDLAFSEMDFLHQPRRYPSMTAKKSAISESAEKERHKVSRQREEISTFFKPARMPPDEVEIDPKHQTPSTYVTNQDSSNTRRMTARGALVRSRFSSFHDEPNDRYSPSDHPAMLHRRLSFPALTMREHHSEFDRKIRNRRSAKERASSIWSETQYSPDVVASPYRSRERGHHDGSPIPETVRRSIEDTGILKDTGIDLKPQHTQSLTGLATQNEIEWADQLPQDQDRRFESRRERMETTASLEPSPSRTYRMDGILQSLQENAQAPSQATRSTNKTGTLRADTGYGSIIERYDTLLGWQKDPHAEGTFAPFFGASFVTQAAREPDNTRITREQLAKHARVKQPRSVRRAIEVSKISGRLDDERTHKRDGVSPRTTSMPGVAPEFSRGDVSEMTPSMDQSQDTAPAGGTMDHKHGCSADERPSASMNHIDRAILSATSWTPLQMRAPATIGQPTTGSLERSPTSIRLEYVTRGPSARGSGSVAWRPWSTHELGPFQQSMHLSPALQPETLPTLQLQRGNATSLVSPDHEEDYVISGNVPSGCEEQQRGDATYFKRCGDSIPTELCDGHVARHLDAESFNAYSYQRLVNSRGERRLCAGLRQTGSYSIDAGPSYEGWENAQPKTCDAHDIFDGWSPHSTVEQSLTRQARADDPGGDDIDGLIRGFWQPRQQY